jgi:hypothetical protein
MGVKFYSAARLDSPLFERPYACEERQEEGLGTEPKF